jgi:hypothetical protein
LRKLGGVLTNATSRRSSVPATIFVAYPYGISKADYRGAYTKAAKGFDVEFVYADEEITNKHILDKIDGIMRRAEFSLFDITQWNANVTLELGLAIGRDLNYYILFNPTERPDAPADLGGIDRIQYHDYTELREGLRKLLRQKFGMGPHSGPPVALEHDASQVQLRKAALLLRTELLDIRNKIANFGKDSTIPEGFAFPAFEWGKYRELVANDQRLYEIVAKAYTQAHRVSEIFAWRRTVSTSQLIGVNDSDGLAEADAAANAAVVALNAIIADSSAE